MNKKILGSGVLLIGVQSHLDVKQLWDKTKGQLMTRSLVETRMALLGSHLIRSLASESDHSFKHIIRFRFRNAVESS